MSGAHYEDVKVEEERDGFFLSGMFVSSCTLKLSHFPINLSKYNIFLSPTSTRHTHTTDTTDLKQTNNRSFLIGPPFFTTAKKRKERFFCRACLSSDFRDFFLNCGTQNPFFWSHFTVRACGAPSCIKNRISISRKNKKSLSL